MPFKSKLLRTIRRLSGSQKITDTIEQIQLDRQLELIREALGRIENRQLAGLDGPNVQLSEFRAFSQWGEDGIIQRLIHEVPIKNKSFVEFGVEDYKEANTRFLLLNDRWDGLVIDGDHGNINKIKSDSVFWGYGLKAICSFITKDNINQLLADNGMVGEIGILSIDIDGNDYWIWQAIDDLNPAIVITEYNYRYGNKRAVTIPYQSTFVRTKPGNPLIYYGASLAGLCQLAETKGYSFIGCNSQGLNAFFVRNDLLPATLKKLTPEEGYVRGKHRESKNDAGEFIDMTDTEAWNILDKLPLIDLDSKKSR